MYCTCCGEVIEPEDVLSEEICDACFGMINDSKEEILFDDDNEIEE